LFLLAGPLFLAGCGGGPSLIPVKGKVTVDGQPVTSGHVTFNAASDDKDNPGQSATGIIDENGNYELSTGGKPGAAKGKYKVVVSPSMVPAEGAKKLPKTPFHSKYGDLNKTTLLVEVVEDANPEAYHLKLTK
jgi:hypothetical protein